MKATLLDLGYLKANANLAIDMDVMPTLDNPNPDFRWNHMPLTAVLVDHPTEGYILFDAGVDIDLCLYTGVKCLDLSLGLETPAEVEAQIPPNIPACMLPCNRLENQLALVGVKPADIKKIVLSHLHFDHVGQLDLFNDRDDVTVYVSKVDYEMFGLKRPKDDKFNYVFLEGDYSKYDLGEGIELLHLPGHTPGLVGMKLTLPNTGTLVITSDAIYSPESYGPPVRQPSTFITSDIVAWHASVEKIRSIEREENATIIFGHDAKAHERYKYAPESYN